MNSLNKCTEKTDLHLIERTRRERANSSLWKEWKRGSTRSDKRTLTNLHNK